MPHVDVSVTASGDRRRLAVFLVNRYLGEAVMIALAFEGLQPPASGRLRQIGADSPFARNDFEQPDRLRILEVDACSSSKLEFVPAQRPAARLAFNPSGRVISIA